MSSAQYKSVVVGPLTGPERTWIHDLPQDNLVAALLMCTAEICRLQDEIAVIKAQLSNHGIAVPARTDVPGSEEKLAQEEATTVVTRRVLSELFRSNNAWTSVDSRIEQFFHQPRDAKP
jgi:hypothetical protein